ncbi:50S ribosomal protein L5 [Acidaminobacterium chupaoyuni]
MANVNESTYVPRMKKKYLDEVAPALMKKFSYKSVMQIPKLDKITVNVGCGEARDNSKALDAVVSDLAKITGQKPVITKAKKSVANFKLREGMPIGAKVTLRGERMWEFLDRFFSVALPRVRDFRGINPNGFDGRGNYAVGMKEQLIFPEIDYDKIDKIRGMDIVFTTSAKNDEEARELLTLLGAPFAK